jgi:hypothetical protein
MLNLNRRDKLMKRRLLVLAPVLALMVLYGGAQKLPAQSEIPEGVRGNVLFILDCSMQSGGKKDPVGELRVAKQVIAAEHILSKIPPATKVGLRVFGNNYTGFDTDCQQSALLAPIARGNRRSICGHLRTLKPTGFASLTYALMQAENDLRYFEGTDSELYLLTAGNDTCGGDPCSLVTRMKAISATCKINVYYFEGGNSLGREVSRFIASKSGGKWTDVDLDADLKSLFEKAPALQRTAKIMRKSARRFLNQPNPLQFQVPKGTTNTTDGGIDFGISVPGGKVGPYIPLNQ